MTWGSDAMSQQVPSDLIDLETARRETGVTTSTIRSWIRYRKLRAWKRGYYNVVSRLELAELIEKSRAIRPASPPYEQEDEKEDGEDPEEPFRALAAI
jgi:hypothetical protein